MTSDSDRPFSQQLAYSLISLALITLAIYLGQDILVPLAMAGLLAVLLRPLEDWLTRRGLPKVLAISVALMLSIIVLVGLGIILSMQLAHFSDDLPKLKQHLTGLYNSVRHWIQQEYNVSYQQQDQYLKKAQTQTLDSLQSSGAGAVGALAGPLGTLLLLPIYVFLLLYYRTMLVHFVVALFAEKQTARVREILTEVKAVIQSYVVGLLIETSCVAALNSIGLLVLGVQYAILLGIISAILNLIPYIGGLIAILLTVLVTVSFQPEFSVALGVVAVFLVVQFIDNNVFVPFIVASKVKINALISIIGVLIGGALAGVSGMFLSIPAIAILKVIFDRIDGLKAWGIVLGDETPEDKGSTLFRLPKRKKRLQTSQS